ncbi:MAG: Acetylornithine/succinyldiaminopimelate aminotransferase [Gemmatimonadetes bacterium]|jgi:acetylornithine/N-succinyldiaminopimelate aminotransferase|nr:Acetylornithine/succinyldiaminopimelate aminotransferase [Gemmatimonadota bacterium]
MTATIATGLNSATRDDRTSTEAQSGSAGLPVPMASSILPTYKRAPVEFVRGAGVHLYDTDGRAYLDLVSGIAVNALGYDDPGLKAAMHAAADGLVHTSNLYSTSAGERLASALVSRSFADKVFFCNSGAEANEGAFKFARRWARTLGDAKHEIVALRGAFHGRLFGTLAATDRPAYRLPFRPLVPGVSIFERDLAELDAALSEDTVAALILEPVQGEGGVRVLDAGLLRELRALTKARNIALILDEIQCGLGRTGTLFAYEQAGIEPDMVTLAKPLAGGLPMGAILMTDAIAAAVKPGDHGTTFGGGPFVASVALHVLDRLSDPAMLKHVRETGAWMERELHEIARRTGRIRQVRGIGMMWGIDVMGTAAHVISEALGRGLLLCSAGDYTVRMLPPLVATREELAHGLHILEEIL